MSTVSTDNIKGQNGTIVTMTAGHRLDAHPSVVHIQHQETSGTSDPQTITADTWTKLTLNTVVTNQVTGASLSTDQITLPAGTYKIVAEKDFSAYTSLSVWLSYKLRLRNTTDSTTDVVGRSSVARIASGVGAGGGLSPSLRGVFTIAGSKTFELQYYATDVPNATGGEAASSGEVEIYTDVWIEKIG